MKRLAAIVTGLGLIAGYTFSAPHEDLKLKAK
jgi:hypothetical protein